MDLLDKLAPIEDRIALFSGGATPFDTVIDEVCSPTEVIIGRRRTLMCGANNYLGLSFHPSVVAAARDAIDREGAGTTGARAANGTFAAHRRRAEPLAQALG